MKTSLLLGAFLFSSPVFADNYVLNCKVAKMIDENIFEEGVSRHEYPDVSVKKSGDNLQVRIGSLQTFDTRNGDSISVTPLNNGSLSVKARFATSKWTVGILAATEPNDEGKKWGQLNYKEDNASSWKKFAVIICK